MFQKIKVLIYLLFCGLAAHSQNNSLVIVSSSSKPMFVFVNDEPVNKIAECIVKIFDINAGWNKIEIKIPGIIKELSFKDSILLKPNLKFADKEFTYILSEKEGKLELQFSSVSELSGPKVPPVPVEPKESAPLVDNSIYGNLYKAVNNKPKFFDNYDRETSSCKMALTDKELQYALKLMSKANDKETAYRYLKQIIDNNCYSTIQLKQLLETVPIDMDKLNSAKIGYSHLTDQQNGNTLLSVFKYAAMKESFTNFLVDQENIIKQRNLNCKDSASEEKFNLIYTKIKNTPYENDKLTISKKLLIDICLSSIQIKKIGDLYTHDREKLEYMKSALNILTDAENAKTLADEFQYQGTKDEFLKYISK